MKKALSELRDEFDVRLNPLDQNYVIDLALLYESGVKLPPLKVTRDGMIVDGRNRYHAMLMAGLTETEVSLVSGTRSELLSEQVRPAAKRIEAQLVAESQVTASV